LALSLSAILKAPNSLRKENRVIALLPQVDDILP
jgi:hypothetical protein